MCRRVCIQYYYYGVHDSLFFFSTDLELPTVIDAEFAGIPLKPLLPTPANTTTNTTTTTTNTGSTTITSKITKSKDTANTATAEATPVMVEGAEANVPPLSTPPTSLNVATGGGSAGGGGGEGAGGEEEKKDEEGGGGAKDGGVGGGGAQPLDTPSPGSDNSRSSSGE